MSAVEEIRHATRVSLTLGSTTQTGEFQFSKVTIGLERDLAALENPLDAYRDISALLNRALQEIKSSHAPRNELAEKDTTPSSTPLEKVLDSLAWAPGKTPGREWIRIKDHAELKQALGLIQEKAVNGYCSIGRHVYRIEGDFLGRYPKHESAKA
jgi:hypothetical protein